MNRTLALALLIFANALWGGSYAISKLALEEMPPPLLAALRLTSATALLWLLVLWQGRTGDFAHPPPTDRRKLMLLGLCCLGLDYLLGYWGVSLTTATDASLMIIGEVIFTSLLAVWLLGDRLGARKLVGIILGVAGVATLVLGNLGLAGGGDHGWSRAAGNLLMLTGLLAAAFYSILGTGMARRYRPLTVVTYANTGSLLLWVPLLAWFASSGSWPSVSQPTVLAVAYLVFVNSFFCPLLWFYVLSRTNANLGAVALFAQPLVGALLGLLVLGDPLTPALAAGGALIFAALYLTSMPERRAAAASQPPAGTIAEA